MSSYGNAPQRCIDVNMILHICQRVPEVLIKV